jgi:branched-chain amino acid transport system permease protein
VIVIGGMGSLRGAFVGSLLIGEADTFGKAYLPSLSLFLIYLMMAAVLLVRPQGLFGVKYTGVSAAPAVTTVSAPATAQARAVGAVVILAMLVYPFVVADYPRALAAEIYIFAIFAMSLDLLLGFTGLMSLGHAAFFGLGAYAVAILGTLLGINAWLALIAGVLLAAAGAALIGFFCVRTSGIPFLMLTLAFAQLVFSIALKWRDVTGGSDGMAIAEKPGFFGFDLANSLPMYFMALVFLLLSYWALRRLLNAPLGHVFVGIRENEPRMLAIGYPTRAYKLLAFTIAGAFAGLSGALYAIFNSFISPDALYWTASGDILIMTMLGGAGTLIGPAIGAGVFLLMKNVVSSYSEHWLAIIGTIFICCVLFFPGGIWGALRQLRWRRRKA